MSLEEDLARWHSVSWIDSRGVRKYWPLSNVPGIREAQLETGPGKCCFCEAPLEKKKSTRPPLICGSIDCELAYHAEYSRLPRRREANRKYQQARADRNRAKGLRADGKPRTGRKQWFSRER